MGKEGGGAIDGIWLRCFQIKSSLTDFPFRALSSISSWTNRFVVILSSVVRTVAERVSKQLSWIVLRRGFSSLSRLRCLAPFFFFLFLVLPCFPCLRRRLSDVAVVPIAEGCLTGLQSYASYSEPPYRTSRHAMAL